MFPMIDAVWSEASQAIARLQPAAVLVSDPVERVDVVEPRLWHLAEQVAAQRPYVPLLVIDPKPRLPANAIPFSQAGGNIERLSARLRAALRIRTLHATVLRRLADDPAPRGCPNSRKPIRSTTQWSC